MLLVSSQLLPRKKRKKKTNMFSVVVPAYNEEKTISKCLKAIKAQDCELIVVVGGNDNTAKIAKKYGKVLKDKACKGAGPARNQGAEAAKGEVVLFTDGDTVVPEKWAENYERIFEDKSVVGAGGIVKPLDGSIIDKIVFKINQDWLYGFTALFGFYQFSGNNCAYRRKDFLKIGGFDEEMSMLEDTELPLRLKGKKVFDSSVYVYTSPRRMKKSGYLSVWFKFMQEYIGWFLFGRKPGAKYFASDEAKS